MSPASYLTAPPRVAADILAPLGPRLRSAGVNWAVYGALILAGLAVAGGLAFLVARALEAWRTLKRLRRGLAGELTRLADLGEATAEKSAAGTDSAEPDESVPRLRV